HGRLHRRARRRLHRRRRHATRDSGRRRRPRGRMIAIVGTEAGTFAVDLDDGEVWPWDGDVEPAPELELNLPRVVAAAAAGSIVIAVVDAPPPMLLSHDTGSTWAA